MCVCEVAQSCPTLCDPMDCSLPGYSAHGIFQARVLEWAAIPFSRGSSQPRDWTRISCTAGRHFTVWATREAHGLKRVMSFQETQALTSLFTEEVLASILYCDPPHNVPPEAPVFWFFDACLFLHHTAGSLKAEVSFFFAHTISSITITLPGT